MSMDRRDFLKIAGITGLLGAGAAALSGRMPGALEAASTSPNSNALKAKQWAMVIDMRKFKTPDDYKKVIHACHSIHNIPEFGNPKDEIKWIWTDTFEHTFVGQEHEHISEAVKEKPFVLLCNHCEKPACVRVCPTKATFKRKDGIVMMDYHRCIGCRFCMAACPFGARSFNYRDPRPFIKDNNLKYPTRMKGVVEKCTFCVERLDEGLMPACVEACKDTKALVFGDLGDPASEVRKVLKENFTIRRKPELGTSPSVYYIVGGGENAG